MSADPGYDPKELRTLLAALCDGHLDEAGHARLEQVLHTSPSARRTYLRYVDLHLEVGRRFEIEGAAVGNEGRRPTRHARVLPALAAIAAVLAVGAGLALVFHVLDGGDIPAITRQEAALPAPDESPVAIIGSARGVVWNRDDVSPETGVSLKTGAYALREGELGLGFINGAEVTLGAPADFVILSPLEIYLTEGRVAAQVPESASGFTIRSKDMALVDIGTAFSVNVKPSGVSRVLVREGEVVASLLGKNGTTVRDYRASAGDGFEINAAAAAIRAMDMGDESFVEPFALLLPEFGLDPSYALAVQAAKPLAYWRFETLDQNAAWNTVSPRFPAHTFGPVYLDGGAENQSALFLPGEDMSGFFVSEPLPGLNRRGYTIEFWMNARAIQYATLVGLIKPGWPAPHPDGSESKSPDYLSVIELTSEQASADGLIQRARSLRFLHRSPAESSSGVNVFSNSNYQPLRWTHVAAVCEGDLLRLYIDGRPDQEVAHSSPPGDDAYQVVVGRLRPPGFTDYSRHFSGALDELALYDRPLTAAEVKAHFDAARLR